MRPLYCGSLKEEVFFIMEKQDLVFKTPFSRKYWQVSFLEMNKIKTITFSSILLSLTLILETLSKLFPLIVFGRQIHFTFIPVALSSLLFGPIMAIITGFISDILGFLLFSGGYPFFPGYTISAIAGALIYALFFYRRRITVLNIFLAKLTVNVFVNAYLGAIWLAMMSSKNTFWYNLVYGFYKNLLLLPFEVIMLTIVFRKLIPIFKSHNMISKNISDKIKFI